MFDNLKNASDWDFIDNLGSGRLHKLNCVGSADDLKKRLRDILNDNKRLVIARECSGQNPEDKRAVIQFYVGMDFFDWFFNGRTGYRAHYREDPLLGMVFNSALIEIVKDHFELGDDEEFDGYEFEEGFENIQPVKISKNFLMNSLHPYYSKIWCCDTRIEEDCSTEKMTIFRSESIFKFNNWKEVFPDSDDCSWLDIKGGFKDSVKGYLYQLKEPLLERANNLHDRGTA